MSALKMKKLTSFLLVVEAVLLGTRASSTTTAAAFTVGASSMLSTLRQGSSSTTSVTPPNAGPKTTASAPGPPPAKSTLGSVTSVGPVVNLSQSIAQMAKSGNDTQNQAENGSAPFYLFDIFMLVAGMCWILQTAVV